MARKQPRPPNPNNEIKLAIAQWKIYTGQPQYELARQLGISPSMLSQIASGYRPGTQYVEGIARMTQKIA